MRGKRHSFIATATFCRRPSTCGLVLARNYFEMIILTATAVNMLPSIRTENLYTKYYLRLTLNRCTNRRTAAFGATQAASSAAQALLACAALPAACAAQELQALSSAKQAAKCL